MKLFLLLLIVNITSEAQYQWNNPKPSAYKLNGVHFLDSLNGWVVGENSTALKTINGGSSWTQMKIPLFSSLCKVHFVDKNKGWIIGGDETASFGSVLLTTDGGENWINHNPEGTFGWNDISVISKDLIFIGGFHGIYKSTDGGYNWIKSRDGFWTTTVFFIDSLTGWFGNTQGYIYKTSDGGENWDLCCNLKFTWIKSIKFVDKKTGYIVTRGLYSNDGKIYKSVDGGNSWTIQYSVYNSTYNDLDVRDSLNATAIGDNGLVKYTVDGGKIWYSDVLSNNSFFGITTKSNKTWIVGGELNYGSIFRGKHNLDWEEMCSSYTKSSINYIDFADINNGISVGSAGTILKTSNSGNSWQNINVFSTDLTSISYLDLNTIFIAGRMGEFIKTTNGGGSWEITYPFPKYSSTKIKFFSKLLGYASSENGSLFKTTDSGLSWEEFGEPWQYDLIYVDSLNFWTILNPLESDFSIIYHSTDGGVNWKANELSFYIEEMFFLDENNGWLSNQQSLYKTSDGGDNWSLVNDNLGFSIKEMIFTTDNIGFLLTNESLASIKYTSDGGNSFHSIINYTSLETLFHVDNKLWSTDRNGRILEINIDKITNIKVDSKMLPTNISLEQNYPNPFNPTTTIYYTVPRNSFIKLEVFDILGNSIEVLADKYQQKGIYKVLFRASKLSSGIYFYRLQIGSYVETKKMLLMK